MIISYTNNFVAIRPAKTGSTSLLNYLLRSGLLDSRLDTYTLDGQGEVHVPFSNLVQEGLIEKNMPCVSTIRNPIERMSSGFYCGHRNDGAFVSLVDEAYRNPNVFWDTIKQKNNFPGLDKIVLLQCDYFPDHAELFNTENLHEHVSKYILERGGKVGGRIEMRKNPGNNLDWFLAELTPDRKQDILDTYAKDFELWEKAYAVYN